MNDWIYNGLSAEQNIVVSDASQRKCILASAGSGKTKTLVHLIAADLASGIPASSIIAFTFTEKAADELLTRVHTLVKKQMPDIPLEGMYLGTIHSWCLQYLLAQSSYYNLEPIDELQVDALVSRLYDYLQLEATYGKSYPKAVENFIADLEIFYNENIKTNELPAVIEPCITKFLSLLKKNRLVTFGGMIRYALETLSSNGPVAQLTSLYVDEYQDVNPAQVSLIKSMVGAEKKVVVVGDDLQCIYNWRGSDVKRILDFDSDFQHSKTFRLLKNYRSRPSIVHFANKVSSNIAIRDKNKEMNPDRPKVTPPEVHWIRSHSEEAEAIVLANIIENLGKQGVPWNKIAILFRSVLGNGQQVVDQLTAREIPVQCPILSRGGAFINEFVLPLLEWLKNEQKDPKNEQEEKQIEAKTKSLWESAKKWMPPIITEAEFWTNINAWLNLIENQKSEAYDVRGRFYDFLNACGIYIKATDYDLMMGIGITSQIFRSVEEIHRRRLQEQQRKNPRGVITEVYYMLKRKQMEFGECAPIDTNQNSVLVSTVHQAKGLEWPIVIIPMLVNGCFPIRRQKYQSTFDDAIVSRYGTTIDDERRLFYVAVTRARERLFLLDPAEAKTNGSLFLKEQNLVTPSSLSGVGSDVWAIEKQDLKESDPSPIRIGLSDILIYVECPYQFGLRRVVTIQPSVGEELGYGKGLHELIQRRLDYGKPWTPEELKKQINENVFLPYMSEQAEANSHKAIQNDMTQMESLGVFTGKVDSEVKVELILDKGIIQGTIDGIKINQDGDISIQDWKSNIHPRFIPRYERQLQFYSYALRAQGKKVILAEIVDVAGSVKGNQIIKHTVDISENVTNSLINTLNQSLEGIAVGNYSASSTASACSCCDMFRICAERVNS